MQRRLERRLESAALALAKHAEPPTPGRMRGVVLIGYRSSGKTTAGRRCAERLTWPFIDLDVAWEARYGVPIADYFAKAGEGSFRDREATVLAEALAQPGPWVIATGGGVVLRAENRAALAAWGGPVLYLHAPAEVLCRRLVRHPGGRPSLTGASIADEVAVVLAQREPLYRACASAVVDASQSIGALVDAVVAIVENPEHKSSP